MHRQRQQHAHHSRRGTSNRRQTKASSLLVSRLRHNHAEGGISPEPFPTRDIRVRVKGALKYADRLSAVGSGVMNDSSDNNDINRTASFELIEIVSLLSNNNNHNESRETVLLAGKLPHPIHLNQDKDEIDFEIEDNILCSDDGTKEQGDPFHRPIEIIG